MARSLPLVLSRFSSLRAIPPPSPEAHPQAPRAQAPQWGLLQRGRSRRRDDSQLDQRGCRWSGRRNGRLLQQRSRWSGWRNGKLLQRGCLRRGGAVASSSSAGVSGAGGAGGSVASSSSAGVGGAGGAGGSAASSSSAGVGGAGGSAASSSSAGVGGAGGSAASSSSASSSGTGGSTCGLIGAGDLLWSQVSPYPHAPGFYPTTTCWPYAMSVRTSNTGGALMRLDFPNDASCWVAYPNGNGAFPGYLANNLTRFDNAGQPASGTSIINYNSYPISSHKLMGGADVDGSGAILRGETTMGVHPTYFNWLSNGSKAAFGFGFTPGRLRTRSSIPTSRSSRSPGVLRGRGGLRLVLQRRLWRWAVVWLRSPPARPGLRLPVDGVSAVGLQHEDRRRWQHPRGGRRVQQRLQHPCGALSPGASLLKLDIGGSCVYQRPIPGEFVVTADGAGNAIIAGKFSGTIDLGGGPLTAEGVNDLAVAKYDASGAHLWSQRFGGPGFDPGVWAVTANAAGEVALQAGFAGTVDFGAGPVDAAGPCAPDTFIAKLAPTGAVAWAKYLHSRGPSRARSIRRARCSWWARHRRSISGAGLCLAPLHWRWPSSLLEALRRGPAARGVRSAHDDVQRGFGLSRRPVRAGRHRRGGCTGNVEEPSYPRVQCTWGEAPGLSLPCRSCSVWAGAPLPARARHQPLGLRRRALAPSRWPIAASMMITIASARRRRSPSGPLVPSWSSPARR